MTTTWRDATGMVAIAVMTPIGKTLNSLFTVKSASAVIPTACPAPVLVLCQITRETHIAMTATTRCLATGMAVTAAPPPTTWRPNTATIAYVWTPTTLALDVSINTWEMDFVMMQTTAPHAITTMATAARTDTMASSGTVKNAHARILQLTLLQKNVKGSAARINTRVTNTAMMITTTAAAAGTPVTVARTMAMLSNSSTVTNVNVWTLITRNPLALSRLTWAIPSATIQTTRLLATGTEATAAGIPKTRTRARLNSIIAQSVRNVLFVRFSAMLQR